MWKYIMFVLWLWCIRGYVNAQDATQAFAFPIENVTLKDSWIQRREALNIEYLQSLDADRYLDYIQIRISYWWTVFRNVMRLHRIQSIIMPWLTFGICWLINMLMWTGPAVALVLMSLLLLLLLCEWGPSPFGTRAQNGDRMHGKDKGRTAIPYW